VIEFGRVCVVDEMSASIEINLAPDAAVFSGHFPGHPILPGVVQVDWAIRAARALLKCDRAVCAIENLKFQRVIGPNLDVMLHISYVPLKQQLLFRYESYEGVHSSGRGIFGDA
jgi:3-hydroxymyristoyl/3-hydroxydecanoyl-(acyl carrier protein) dehydratase